MRWPWEVIRKQREERKKAKIQISPGFRAPARTPERIEDDILGATTLSGGGKFLEFMQQFAVNPASGQAMFREAGGRGTITPYNDRKFENWTITDPNRMIAYVRLTKDIDLPGGDSYSVDVYPHDAGDRFPVYFLSWTSRVMAQITLPAMGTHDPDPDIFLTAGINGCSVFFKDPGQTPTVYHAGIDSSLHGKLPTSNSGKFWRQLLLEKEAGLANQARGHKTFGEVKSAHYVNQGTQDSTFEGTTQESRAFTQRLSARYQGQFVIQQVNPWGCVFGVRDEQGDWTFYLQENAAVTYYRAGDNPNQAKTARVPMRLSQVFPGRAHVVISSAQLSLR